MKVNSTEKPFNQIELSNNNEIENNTAITFIDTIASVGLDELGLKGIKLLIYPLTETAKDNFNGELKAHIRYFEGTYYLFIDEMSREKSITVVSHELIHITQYHTGVLDYLGAGSVLWQGDLYSVEQLEYEGRPWEMDAYARESELSTKVSGILY